MPQARAIAQVFNLPQLADVFYYGKEYRSPKQKMVKGKLEQDPYREFSVTDFQREAWQDIAALEEMAAQDVENQAADEVAEAKQTKENDVNGILDEIFGAPGLTTTVDELLNIIKGA